MHSYVESVCRLCLSDEQQSLVDIYDNHWTSTSIPEIISKHIGEVIQKHTRSRKNTFSHIYFQFILSNFFICRSVK